MSEERYMGDIADLQDQQLARSKPSSTTVRAVAEYVQRMNERPGTVTAADMAVLRALGTVLVFSGDDDHPLTRALYNVPEAPSFAAIYEVQREAGAVEPNCLERRCATCGCEWTGSDFNCPQCADEYRREYMEG